MAEEDLGGLVGEKLGRLADRVNGRLESVEASMNARLQMLEAELAAYKVLQNERSLGLKENVTDLKKVAEDHESRIRTIGEATTKNQVVLGLASGGSGLVSIIALLKAWLGGP
jgi:hypothetical protein